MKSDAKSSAKVKPVEEPLSQTVPIRKFTTRIPIFGAKLIAYFTPDPATVLRSMGVEDEEFIAGCRASTTMHQTPGKEYPFSLTMVFDYETVGHGLLSHEIQHCVYRTLGEVGVLFENNGANEEFCYLAQFITAWLYGKIYQNKIEITRC